MENIYIEFLDKQDYLRKEYWLDRQYTSNGQITEYQAYFYIVNYKEKFFGIVESERPNSATYVYDFPDKNIKLHSYIYKNHFAEPYIQRDADAYYIDKIKRINVLYKLRDKIKLQEFKEIIEDEEIEPEVKENYYFEWKKYTQKIEPEGNIKIKEITFDEEEKRLIQQIESEVYQRPDGNYFDEDDEYSIDEELSRTKETGWTPIKYRSYFVGEVDHINLKQWIVNLEELIIDYANGNFKKTKPKYHFVSDNPWNNLEYATGEFFNDIATQIKTEIISNRRNNKREKKKCNKINPTDTKKDYNPTVLYNEKIKDIALRFNISPHKLLFTIQERILNVKVNSIDDILDANKVSLCQRIFEELWYINNKRQSK